MGGRAFSKYLWGKEDPSGTAVAADTFLLGAEIGAIPVDRVPTFPEDNMGVRARSSRAIFYQYLVQNSLRIPHGYFQILPMIFSCGLKGTVTPVEQTGSQLDYLWTFAPSLTATNSLNSITLEMGDDTQAYEVEYVQFERIRMSGVVAQGAEASPVEIEVDYYGRQVTPTTFSTVAVPSVTPINAKFSRIYIDSAFASAGGTEITSLLRSWELEILTGAHYKFFGSGLQTFDTHDQAWIDVMLTMVWEGGSKADTQYDLFRLGTEQVITIKLDSGVQIGTGDNHNFQLDIWGAYEHITPLNEEDRGNNLHAALFHGLYDGTAADMIDFNVTTNVASI
jgi:hypothetical protein